MYLYDFLARIKNHINTTILRCSNLNIGGNIFILELDNIELPNMIVYDVNILSAPLIIHENKGSAKTLISIDLDCVELSDITTLTGYEPTVSIQFIFKDNINPDKIFNVHYSITDLNNTVINHNDFLTINENLEDYTISLNGITISNNILDIGDKVINILYSILIVNE